MTNEAKSWIKTELIAKIEDQCKQRDSLEKIKDELYSRISGIDKEMVEKQVIIDGLKEVYKSLGE